MNENVIRKYTDILQRILTDQSHSDFTAVGFCVEFARELSDDTPDLTTHRGRVQFVKDDPECRALNRDWKYVAAVKRLREQSVKHISLVDARDAVYNAWGMRDRGLLQNEWIAS